MPLFIFMGSLLERSGIAERLFEAIHLWTRRLPGGLAVGTVILCVIFAAASGVVGATESVVGLLAIPVMLRYAYDKGLISGTICAGGSLGTIIPPSVVVVILGPVADVDVGSLFMGMLFPGLILAGLYILYILGRCIVRPRGRAEPAAGRERADAPPEALDHRRRPGAPRWCSSSRCSAPSCSGGRPRPSGGDGRPRLGADDHGLPELQLGVLKEALSKTILVTAMILTILLAGNIFATVFTISGGLIGTQNLVEAANLSGWATLGILLLLAFIAGFVLDLISIILIIIPIAMPIISKFSSSISTRRRCRSGSASCSSS